MARLTDIEKFKLMGWMDDNRKTVEDHSDNETAVLASTALNFTVKGSHVLKGRKDLKIVKEQPLTLEARIVDALVALVKTLHERHSLTDSDAGAILNIICPPAQPQLFQTEQG